MRQARFRGCCERARKEPAAAGKNSWGTGISIWLKKSPNNFAGSSQPAYSKSWKHRRPSVALAMALWKPKSEGEMIRTCINAPEGDIEIKL